MKSQSDSRAFLALAVAALLASASPAAAQNLTIQQPVFGVNSIGTTVSVPDRGRASLGGIRSARDSRSSTGPLRSGSSLGSTREAGGMSVHATIHDFDEMDRFLLESAPNDHSSIGATSRTGPDPYQELLAKSQRRGQSRAATSRDSLSAFGTPSNRKPNPGSEVASAYGPSETPTAKPIPPTRAATDNGETSFRLGQKAAERGALSVARMHYKLAAKHGHPDAQVLLEGMDDAPSKVAKDARPLPQ